MTDNLGFNSFPEEISEYGSDGINRNHRPAALKMTTPILANGPLKQAEVYKLRDLHGLNTVETGRKRPWYKILLTALVHPFNVLLVILATTSGAMQEFETMTIMFVMVFISTMLRFHQEWRSEIAAESLLKFVATKVFVIRNDPVQCKDVESQIPSVEIVPGDHIRLFPGDLVPADVQIIEAKDFHVSQAALTGEAIPIQKYLNHRESREYQQYQNGSQTFSCDDVTLITKQNNEHFTTVKQPSFKKRLSALTKCLRNIFGLPVYADSSFSVDPESGPMKSDLDRPDLCFMGSAVVSGTALCRVLSTGSQTHFGKMAVELAKRRPQNAFQLGVKRISWIFFITMILLVPPVLILQGLIVKNWYDAFLFALAVAVGLTPEMLPMIVNTTLAKGATEMSRKHCIVKQLDAIINMGGIDILCTDKTGTLTQSIVTLNKYVNQQGLPSSVPLFLGYLNSHFQSVQQNPLDNAIVSYFDHAILQSRPGTPTHRRSARQSPSPIKRRTSALSIVANIASKFELIDELPFDFVRRRMSVVVREVERDEPSTVLICKGAVEEVLGLCSSIVKSNDRTNVYSVIRNENEIVTEDMTPEILTELRELNENLSGDGLRVIAVSYKRLPGEPKTLDDEDESAADERSIASFRIEDEKDLTFAGFLAFLDPPKEDTKDAIKNLLEHNINIKVLTGDNPLVCKKICREIGLEAEKVVTGNDLVAMGSKSPEDVSRLVEEATIFAKLTPIQKSDIVRILKKNGHIVGFLGDGINDAPALTEADVGISVDSGTDICKESADIILLEKDLTVIVDGVVTGRRTYGNTLKYIVMAVSSNFGNVFSMLVASAWLPFQPMGAFHILTQNLLYDISQISIPWDNMDPEFLQVPHRWSMKSVLKFMVMIGPWSSVFDITTFLFMYFYFEIQTPQDSVLTFQTAWFTVGLLTQTLIVHMIRTPKIPFVQSCASFPVVFMTIVIMSIGLALPYVPGLNNWLQMVYLPWQFYPFLATVLFLYCCSAQFAKVLYLRLFKEWY